MTKTKKTKLPGPRFRAEVLSALEFELGRKPSLRDLQDAYVREAAEAQRLAQHLERVGEVLGAIGEEISTAGSFCDDAAYDESVNKLLTRRRP